MKGLQEGVVLTDGSAGSVTCGSVCVAGSVAGVTSSFAGTDFDTAGNCSGTWMRCLLFLTYSLSAATTLYDLLFSPLQMSFTLASCSNPVCVLMHTGSPLMMLGSVLALLSYHFFFCIPPFPKFFVTFVMSLGFSVLLVVGRTDLVVLCAGDPR